ncbi:MAG TPA: AbrB family transcriptional regulator [Phycisphaerae bacterium]|nr:AbrB family transcriptional regulator [Phycisphaerae bacterium]
MMTAQCDKKGRLQLSSEVRRRYGERFFIVEAPGELVLLPVPDDPVKDLRQWGKPLQGMSMEEIKQAIQEQAEKEVSMLGLR